MMSSRIASKLSVAAIALAAVAASGVALGEEPEPMNRVAFQVESSREVENDRVTFVLGVTEEDEDPAKVADRINRAMSWALETARATPDIVVRSGGYRTFPVHHEAKIRRWRGTQELVIEAPGVSQVSELIGELQTRLQVQSVGFTVSPERRREVEDALIREALAAFRSRAKLVRESLEASGFELVKISINTGGSPPIVPRQVRAMAAAEVAPPALEAGTSTLVVRASGTIELR
jgi:predicted secreted protein